MADYVNLSILAQAYIHVEPVKLSDLKLDAFKDAIADYATLRSRFFLHDDIDVDVILEDGSLKSKTTIYGTLVGLYLAIGNYGDFRQAVPLIYEDVRAVAELIARESLFLAQARRPQVLRVEARTGVVGQLKRLVTDLESLQRNVEQTSPEQMVAKIKAIRKDAERILENLPDANDRKFVAEGLAGILSDGPKAPLPGRRRPADFDIHVAAYREERRQLRQLLLTPTTQKA